MTALIHGPLSLFIVQAILVIAASRLIGLVTRRARQPMVIAEIVAGVALGPSLLGWLAPDLEHALFPAASMGLLGMMSQLGLILFMFLVGLEFDVGLLRGRGHTAIAISHTSIVVPFLLGLWLAQHLHTDLAPPGVPLFSFALFIGVAMSITAFPVLARILVERRLLRTKIGAVAITCAAVDDVTAWCILAFVVSLVRAASLTDGVQTTLLALAYIALMIRVIRPIAKRVAARSANKEGLSQNVVALTLVVLLVSSWVTELIGIHALFGAFVFGAIVPKANGFAQILADKLEDLVVVLLLPLFFAYSGLRTEIGLLDTAHAWAICAVIIVAATAGKFGGSAIAARLTGLRWREASALGVLMNTRGLMELIVLNIGLDLGVITPTLFTMMVIMALVTTFMTTPILERIYPAAVAEAEPSEAEAALTAPGGFTALMCVAYDRSGPGMVTVAAALLGETDDRNRLYALRLLPPTGRASFVLAESQEERDTTALDPLLERADALGVTVRPIAFVSPQPAKDICQVAAVKRADLVLLGWHKPVLGRTVLSGTVHEVMRQSGTSVAVLVDRGLGWISRVLVPYRGGAHDRGAVELAARFAQHAGASVTVLHVVTLDPTKPDAVADGDPLATVVQPRSDNGGRIEVKVVDHSDPMHAVIEECETGYDLVVIGASAEWGLEHRSFGMQPEPIIRDCPASLLIVQHEAAVARAAAAGEEPAVPSVHRA